MTTALCPCLSVNGSENTTKTLVQVIAFPCLYLSSPLYPTSSLSVFKNSSSPLSYTTLPSNSPAGPSICPSAKYIPHPPPTPLGPDQVINLVLSATCRPYDPMKMRTSFPFPHNNRRAVLTETKGKIEKAQDPAE